MDESKLNEATMLLRDVKYQGGVPRFTDIRRAIDIIIEQAQEPLLERIKELEKKVN